MTTAPETFDRPPDDGATRAAGAGRRLTRSRDGRVFAGVCAGLGRYTDIDPVIYRVVLAVLSVFGGSGLLLYLGGWLLIPADGSADTRAEALLLRLRRWPLGQLALVGVVLLAALALADNTGGGAVALVVAIAAVAFLVGQDRRRADLAAPPTAPASGLPNTAPPPAYAVPPPVWVRTPRRERSPLGLLTLSAAVLVLGIGLALDAAGVAHLPPRAGVGLPLLVVGLGLVIGARIGSARWLIAPALLLALVLGALQVVDVPLRGGVGARSWAPASVADLPSRYTLAAGDATLDLSRLAAGSTGVVRATVGAGSLRVTVPADAVVRVHARSGAGAVDVLGGVDRGLGAERDLRTGRAGGLTLDLRVGVGEVVVGRAAS